MLKKFIKEIFKTAVVTTIFGFPFRADTSQTLKQFFTSQLKFYTAITTLSYISAKSSGDTANRNLGIKRAITNPIAPRNIVYGKTRVGGTIVQRTLTAKSASTKNVLHQVIALAGHEINNITKIYIDAGKGIKELDLSDTNDFVSATENSTTVFRCVDPEFVNTDNDEAYTGGSLIKLAFEKGDQTTANGYAVAQMSSASAWSTDHKMLGIAYIYINCIYDTEKFTQIPSFSFEIEGKKVFDPVSSSTVYSTNPALIIRDYLMDSTYGFGATSTEINDAVTGAGFVKARSDCNDSVTLTITNPDGSTTTSSESRYTLNGQFTSTEEPQTVLETMLSACAGQLLYNNGVFSLFVGKERTASGTITDDKILEPIQIQTKFSGRELANGVKATYVRPSDEYIAAEITPYKDSTYLTQDTPSGKAQADYENFINLSFPYTQSSFTAQRLARIALDYQRQNQTLSVLVPLEFLSHQVGDIVNLHNDRLGYSSKDFEIVGMSFEFVGEQYLALRLSLKEYSTTVFNNITYVADPTLPSPPDSGDNTVSSPTGLALAEFTKDSQVRLHFIRASWTNNLDDKIVTTEVAYKKSTDSNFDAADVSYPSNSFSFYVEPATTYNVKVRHISNTGVSSAYTGTVNLTTSGGQVTLTTGTVAGITIESGKLYQGTGTFNNSNTGFFVDSSGQFSLKDKLSFNGTTLNISGNLTVENTITADKIVVGGITLDNLISASDQASSNYLTTFAGAVKIASGGASAGYPAELQIQATEHTNAIGTLQQSQTQLTIRARSNTSNGAIAFQGFNGTTPTNYAIFDASGNLGIGTTSPSHKLDIVGGGLEITEEETIDAIALLDSSNSNTKYLSIQGDNGDCNINASAGDLVLQQGGTSRVTINSGGAAISGDLTVSGTTTTVDTTNTNVKDNNLTLNYSTGDSSSTANNAGITIQDAVNSSTDATILWNASADRFDFSHDIHLPDGAKFIAGNSADINIRHSTNSFIENFTGNLRIINYSDDKDIILESDDGSGGVTEYFRVDGGSSNVFFSKALKIADATSLQIGDGNDFQLSHNGTNTFMANNTGIFFITQNTDDANFLLRADNGSGGVANYITLKGSTGEVILGHYGNFRFKTITNGVDVLNGGLFVGGTEVITSARNLSNIGSITASGDMAIDTNALFVDVSDNRVGIGTTSPSYALDVRSAANIQLKLASTSASNNSRMVFAPNNAIKWNMGVNVSDSAFTWFDQDTNTTPVKFEVGASTNTLVVDSNSSVGIATSSPSASYKLDVNGKVRTQQELLINTGSLIVNQEGEGIHLLSPSGTEYKLTVDNSGNLVTTEQ